VAVLLSAGANVHAADSAGNTALAVTAEAGALETVRLLLQAGAAVNAASLDGTTPLQRAIAPRSVPPTHPGHAAVVAELLKAGAKASMADADGATPLHFAA
jgi:ankyrin repeat protein